MSGLQQSLLRLKRAPERKAALQQVWETEQKLLGAEIQTRAWTGTHSEPVSLPVLQGSLATGQVLVEYLWGEKLLYALVVSRSGARVVRLGEHASIETLVARYFELLRDDGSPSASKQASSLLFRKLLAPLPEVSAKSKVIVVPDGPLHTLPFDMLTRPDGSAFASRATVTLAPSASVWHALRTRDETIRPLPLLALGDVPYGNLPKSLNPSRAAGIFDAKTVPLLEPLPASRSEVERAMSIAGPQAIALLGRDASETSFKQQPLAKFDVIHLAVHAFADPKQPQRGALMLAPAESANEDGFLQPREIVQLPIKARLVVLSACNTTVGRSMGQEGVSNLARAFLSSGATAVLATSWSVTDTASGSLLAEFYRNLSQGKQVSVALRDAKLVLLKKFGPSVLPTVAAFQVIGNGDVIVPLGQNRKPEKGAKP